MTHDSTALYQALAAHDPRFDGVFYVGVTSTGIYCRPVCTARTPKAANCRFFDSAEAAEKANFRPCLRCRPELAPGNAPVDDAHRIANLIAHRIDEGMLDDGAGPESIAKRFGWSSRQIRRMMQRELGVSPMELVLTRRLLLAKQLLTDTPLPIAEIAFASGFASVRRFNDAFNGRYGIPPTQFRKATPDVRGTATSSDTLRLQVVYRPPFDWSALLGFLGARAMRGVECIEGDAYLRTVRLGTHTGWIRVTHAPARRALMVELTHALTPVLPALLGRVRHLFDLSARPDVIAAYLSRDARLAGSVARHPGLRVPGAFDGFELAVRAVIGQQITVQAATTIAGRYAAALGETVRTPFQGLDRLAPTTEGVACARVENLAALGIVRARAESIIALAREMAGGRLTLDPGASPDDVIARLTALPGIGPWTAQYIVMRALRWPDAFPKEDVAARKALGGVSASAADVASQAWRPWRSYALLHLWQTAPASPRSTQSQASAAGSSLGERGRRHVGQGVAAERRIERRQAGGR